jgi:hypothetical protein
MHILKSRNPFWLLLDIIIAVWLWKVGVIVAAVFFTLDALLQLVYTFFPDLIDSWDTLKTYRVFYTVFFFIAIFFIIRYLAAERII